ncbi:uncharacterized protein [Amphiura filiformis]|uniref:uncharacterized protein n=1 Tax=Amphiura filiformis TaxID=82378 RepID=UPI003B21CD1F
MFIVVFLDDGWCVSQSEAVCAAQAEKVKSDLLLAGFVPNVEKSKWSPSQLIEWLGMQWDGCSGSLAITNKRISDIHSSIDAFIYALPSISARMLASLTGKIISIKPVVGNIALLKTRFMHTAILSRNHWDAKLDMRKFQLAIEEVFFWKNNVDRLNIRTLPVLSIPQVFWVLVFTDASSTGFGAIIASDGNSSTKSCVHSWNEGEKLKSSTWRELKAVHTALLSFAPVIKGKMVKLHTDNQGVVAISAKGSMNLELQNIAVDIFNVCKMFSISLEVQWIPRTENQEADSLSRLIDFDDWGVSRPFFDFMNSLWGHIQSIDLRITSMPKWVNSTLNSGVQAQHKWTLSR